MVRLAASRFGFTHLRGRAREAAALPSARRATTIVAVPANPRRTPRAVRLRAPGSAALLLLAALLVLTACQLKDETEAPPGSLPPRETAGPPRSYYLGFSSLPSVLTDSGYQDTFDLASHWGEV